MHNVIAMRCAAYARYSTDLQREESIEDQLRNLRTFAESRSWDILPTQIYADYGISGASTDRPALKAMITAALSRPAPFDVILVDDTSRLSRNLAEAMQLKQQLEFAGIRLIAVSQGVDSADDQADVIWTVHGLIDSFFLKELAKKTHRGMEGLALRGMHTGGRCYGYRSVPVNGGGARLNVHEPEAVVVRRIFQMTAEGNSLKRIAKTLNAEGIRSPQPGTKKKYDSWAPSGIREMIRRELYAGRIVWNKSKKVKVPGTNKRVRRPRPETEWKITEVPELRIVPQETWDRVQERIQWTHKQYGQGARKGLLNRSASSTYLLSGYLKCKECAGNFVIVRGRSTRYASYGCAQHFSRGACTNSIRLPQAEIEDKILSTLQREVLRPEVVELAIQEFRKQLESATGESSSKVKHYSGRIKELETELNNLVNAVAKGNGSQSVLLPALNARERELNELKRLVRREEESKPEQRLPGLADFAIGRVRAIRELIQLDPMKAKLELGKHVAEIVIETEPNGSFKIQGEWDLIGERFSQPGGENPPTPSGPKAAAKRDSATQGWQGKARSRKPKPKWCGVRMVPGGGVEPPRAEARRILSPLRLPVPPSRLCKAGKEA
jgi:site-specific DNA recombinase